MSTAPSEPRQRYTLSDAARFRTFDDEGVVLQQQRNEVLGLNAVGSAVLEALRVARDFDEVVEHVVAEFDVDRDAARADLVLFLNEMVASGVITEQPA